MNTKQLLWNWKPVCPNECSRCDYYCLFAVSAAQEAAAGRAGTPWREEKAAALCRTSEQWSRQRLGWPRKRERERPLLRVVCWILTKRPCVLDEQKHHLYWQSLAQFKVLKGLCTQTCQIGEEQELWAAEPGEMKACSLLLVDIRSPVSYSELFFKIPVESYLNCHKIPWMCIFSYKYSSVYKRIKSVCV